MVRGPEKRLRPEAVLALTIIASFMLVLWASGAALCMGWFK